MPYKRSLAIKLSFRRITDALCVIVVAAFAISLTGCSTNKTEEWNRLITSNATTIKANIENVKAGEMIPAGSEMRFAAARVHKLRWDDTVSAEHLVRQIQRGTRGKYGLKDVSLKTVGLAGRLIRDLPLSTVELLRKAWNERIMEIFTLKYFETDKALLDAAIRGQGVDVHYVLMGRDHSAEMGHADTVDVFLLDSDGRLVSRMKNEYGSRYPYRFVDGKNWDYDFLF